MGNNQQKDKPLKSFLSYQEGETKVPLKGGIKCQYNRETSLGTKVQNYNEIIVVYLIVYL